MQFTLQRRTDLALRALTELGAAPDTVPGATLARAIGTSPGYLPQVMAPLARSGWVSSERGPGGGYRLETSLDELTLLDVVEAIEGPVRNGQCVLEGGPCPRDEHCRLHVPWTHVRDAIVRELGALHVGPSKPSQSQHTSEVAP